MTTNEMKAIIDGLNTDITEDCPEYSEELSVAIGLNDPENDGGVGYWFEDGKPIMMVDTFECHPPVMNAEEFIAKYCED